MPSIITKMPQVHDKSTKNIYIHLKVNWFGIKPKNKTGFAYTVLKKGATPSIKNPKWQWQSSVSEGTRSWASVKPHGQKHHTEPRQHTGGRKETQDLKLRQERRRKRRRKKRDTWGGGVGVVTMIESFPARSEACQNFECPPGPLESLVCLRWREFQALWGWFAWVEKKNWLCRYKSPNLEQNYCTSKIGLTFR